MTRFITATRDWEGQTAIIIGNGPSVLGMDHASIKAAPAVKLVTNGGYKTFPWATVLMCSDRHWLAANPDLSGFLGREVIVTQPQAVARRDYRMVFYRRAFIEKRPNPDPFADPGLLVEGHNSTSTMISLAVLRGVSRIILLGIDLTPGPGGRRHIYDNSIDDPVKARDRYARQVKHLGLQSDFVKARGVEVLNCSPASALLCYPFAKWEDIEWRSK